MNGETRDFATLVSKKCENGSSKKIGFREVSWSGEEKREVSGGKALLSRGCRSEQLLVYCVYYHVFEECNTFSRLPV